MKVDFKSILKNIDHPSTIIGYDLENFLYVNQESLSNRSVKNNIIAFSTKNDDENIEFLNTSSVNHLFGISENLENEFESVFKIMAKSNSKVESLLTFENIKKSVNINHSKDITQEIEVLLDSLDYSKIFESPRDNLRIVLNELLTNAFYHQEGLLDKNRKNSIFTNFNSPVTASIGQDDKCILIYVKDNIGTITRDNIVNSIYRAKTQKSPRENGPGAGLGMAMIYENVNQLHINKKANKSCEFIGVIDINKRYKKFKERVTSFHFYEEI